MMWAARSLAVVLCCAAVPAHALDLTLPANVQQTASRDSTLDQEALPLGPFENGALPTRVVEGAVTRRAYRIPASRLTPLQILAPLRVQLEEAGYEVLLDCNEDSCGGFDFRFAIDVLPAPNMYVNIRAYHFLSAQHPDSDAAMTVLTSAAAGAGYLQIIEVGTGPVAAAQPEFGDTPETATGPDAAGQSDLKARLIQNGHAVLHSLDFAVGTTALTGSEHPELADIAAFMQDRPGLRIAVVGHTDTVGGLDANINVSRARAQSVRRVLIDTYGIAARRIEANGMGYLAPVASNLTAEGREANRRVEVMLVDEAG